ncbi:EcsC family protein [Paucibacter sp. Y2R2-4]|uniref:EcsC family protein n=1 Tax=Paucibacter sp. Y2R2-4 TaxID=2893553 RepID=UPI0021E4E5C9|nr:EcsC family protein [Paucibacter sp. Y2R2-4]MCV2352466.1 EcsC family protein [Paucibacter sp. Y2R2-4]
MSERMGKALLGLIGSRPESKATARPSLSLAAQAAQAAAADAAKKAAMAAGAFALPPGPLGWLTIVPEMAAVWRIQSQLVADIAALYGRTAELGQAQMLYCLFRHTAAQAVRDLAVRVGERMLVRPATTALMQRVVGAVGMQLSQKVLSKSVSRWVPMVGAAAVSAYAYYDTQQVAKAAIEMFEREQIIENPG